MPRIIKKKEEEIITYSVLEREVGSSDYLNDPDLFRDPLPQPYRRIDKILQDVINDAWNIIEKFEREREIESNKYRPNKYSNISVVENLENINCVCPSSDELNEFTFVGQNDTLVCVDSDAINQIDKINLNDERKLNENFKIKSIRSSYLKNSVHLVVSLTDNGNLFMNLFVVNKFYPINYDTESDRKNFYRKFELTSNCNYVALLAESKSNPIDSWIEVYKCPKESWLQISDSLSSYELNKANNNQLTVTNLAENESSDETKTNQINDSGNPSEPQVAQQQQPTIPKPTFVCKIKPPNNLIKLQTVNSSNLNQILKSVDANYDQIGTGANNCFTKTNLDLRAQFFEKVFNIQLNEDATNVLSGNTDSINKIDAEFRFLLSNRFIYSGITYDQQTEIPNSLAVCWNNGNQLFFYPFGKLTKDLESKHEFCMPYSSQITQIELTKCNNLLALALKNNIVVVFDLNAGIERRCVHFENIKSIKRLYFLPPAIPTEMFNLTNTAQFRVSTQLICLTDNGSLYSIDCTLGSDRKPELIFSSNLANKDDKLIEFIPLKRISNLFFVISETKKFYLLDLSKSQLICQLDYDESQYRLEDYQVALASKNQLLYFQAISNEHENNRLLCQSLRLIPVLDDYFNRSIQHYENCLPKNSLLNDRLRNLMKIRIDEQPLRKERLKKLWNELSKHRNVEVSK